jgi:hypothetical protein
MKNKIQRKNLIIITQVKSHVNLMMVAIMKRTSKEKGRKEEIGKDKRIIMGVTRETIVKMEEAIMEDQDIITVIGLHQDPIVLTDMKEMRDL